MNYEGMTSCFGLYGACVLRIFIIHNSSFIIHTSSAPMPVIDSQFRSPAWLRNGHLQSILPVLLPRRFPDLWQRERLELADGDFLDLDWLRAGSNRLALLSHGLEGSSNTGYIRGMAHTLAGAGWDALAWNLRSCSGEPNRLLLTYHSGETRDLRAVIKRATLDYSQIVLIGYSLGGNLTLKYLGESQPDPAIQAAVAISAPVDLASSARAIDKNLSNRIYRQRFIKTMGAKIQAKAKQFPNQLDLRAIHQLCTLEEFDGRFTAPIFGFRDASDYWTQASSLRYLPGIELPTLLLNARNDPFLTEASYPWAAAERSRWLTLEAPESGGHVGFLDLANGIQPWSERRILQWLYDLHRNH